MICTTTMKAADIKKSIQLNDRALLALIPKGGKVLSWFQSADTGDITITYDDGGPSATSLRLGSSHKERCEKCGALEINHAKDHLCRMHSIDGVCEVCGNGVGYLRQKKTIEIVSTYYRVVNGAGTQGLQVDRDQHGNVIMVKELAMWPFILVDKW